MNFKFPSSLDNPPPIPYPNPNSNPISIANPNPNPNPSYYTHQSVRGGFVDGDVNRGEFNGYSTAGDVRSREFNGYPTSGDISRREYNGYSTTGDVSSRYEGYSTSNNVINRDFKGYSTATTGDVSRRDYTGYPAASSDVIQRGYECYSTINDVRHREYDGYSTINGARHPQYDYHQNAGSVQREIEKERIRKEIIAEEMMRRRVLEEEVRRELMLEREQPLYRDVGGSMGSVRIEELYREGEFRGGYSTMPPNRPVGAGGSGVTLREITEVNGVVAHSPVVRKDKAIVLAKPRANFAAVKRKTMMPPMRGPIMPPIRCPTDAFKKRKTDEAWRCTLCQITATSERGLNDHFRGKKHQALENGTVAHKTGFGTELLTLSMPSIPSTSSRPVTVSKLKGTSGGKLGNGKAKGKAKAISAAQLKKHFQFFCEMCQVGANSPIVFDAHKKGKKHLASLSELNKTDEATLGESSIKKAVTEENKELVVKKPEETIVGKKRSGKEKAKPVIGKEKKFWIFCEMCQVGVNTESAFNMHMKGKKHLANLLGLNKTDETAQAEASKQKTVTEENEELAAEEKVDGDVSKVEEDSQMVLKVEGGETLADEETALEVEGGETLGDTETVLEVEGGETLADTETVLEVEGGESLADEEMDLGVEGVAALADTETVL